VENETGSSWKVPGTASAWHLAQIWNLTGMDLLAAGDRLSACQAPMRPLGLTLKKSHKKYSRAGSGELMLVHVCTDCGKVAINRIAADDDVEML
jgi:hypothetical protein